MAEETPTETEGTTDQTSGDDTANQESSSEDTPNEEAAAADTPASGEQTSLGEAADADDPAESEDTDGDEEDGDDVEAEAINYDDLAMPEGATVDEAALGTFKDVVAKFNDGKGLSKADAQELINMRGEMIKAEMATWETTFSEWRGDIQSDKELGGDNFKTKTVPNVLAAALELGGPELVNLMKTNKLYGERPEIIRALNKAGKTLSEDKIEVARRAAAAAPKDAQEILYPNTKPES